MEGGIFFSLYFFAFKHFVVYIISGYPDARMVKLADTQDLGSCIARCVGSSPTSRTIKTLCEITALLEMHSRHFFVEVLFLCFFLIFCKFSFVVS